MTTRRTKRLGKVVVAVLKRDNRTCRRCHSQQQPEVHHVVALMDGGADTPDNCVTLCAECHKEWHLAEMVTKVDFDTWLKLPTYRMSLAFWGTLLDMDFDELSRVNLSAMTPPVFAPWLFRQAQP